MGAGDGLHFLLARAGLGQPWLVQAQWACPYSQSLPWLPRSGSTAALCCMAPEMPCFCPKLSRCPTPPLLTRTLFTGIKALAWASRRERKRRQRQCQQPRSDATIPAQTLACWHLTNLGIVKSVCLLRVSYTVTVIAVASFRLRGQESDELPFWQWISLSATFPSSSLSGPWPSALPTHSPCRRAETRRSQCQQQPWKICSAHKFCVILP